MKSVTNDYKHPAGRRRECQAWDVDIQLLGDVSEEDEELCAIMRNAKPGTLDMPMFTERLIPGNERSMLCPVAIKPTLMSSRHHLEREKSSNGKHRHRYPTVINKRAMFHTSESNWPPKKRHIDVSLEEKLPFKKRVLTKRFFDCSEEEKLPLKKRRVALNSIITQESVYAEQRANNALNHSIQPKPSTSVIPDSLIRNIALDYPPDMDDCCPKKLKRSKSIDDCGTFVGHVIRSSASFHFG